MTKIRISYESDVPRFREMPLVPTPKEDVRQAASGFFVSQDFIAMLPKPQEALEETERLIGFLERCDGVAA